MLGSNDRPHLFQALASNRCVLFVGAGFSAAVTNRVGTGIPTGAALARLLWELAAFKEPYDGSSLAITYEAVLSAGKPLTTVRELLEQHLIASEVPSFYDVVPRIFWYRIYGTNVDNVIEETYRRADPSLSPALEMLAAPAHDFSDRDQFLRRVQYIKLHGSLPGDPRHLTFGTLDLAARANSRGDWWDHFVRDYVFHPTLFIGSELDEPLFWQAIASRNSKGHNPELRPNSYLVSPHISAAKSSLLQSYNITHVPGTAEDFLGWVASEFHFPGRLEVLATTAPEQAEFLRTQPVVPGRADLFDEFLDVFQRPALAPSTRGATARAFLRGAPPTWTDLSIGADAPREINTVIHAAVIRALTRPAEPSLIMLLGEGGAGKSTILRRLAVSLTASGQHAFFADGATRPNVRGVCDALRAIPSKTCLIVDNASLFGAVLNEIIDRAKRLPVPPVIVVASRYIPFEQRLREALEPHQFEELEVPPLSDADIDQILVTLERHNQLGHLIPLGVDARRYEFKQRARKQLLVALMEATEGRGFDEILQSEFRELTEREPRVLFLCAAIATSALVDLSEEQLFACAEVPPAEVLRIVRRDLRGMLHAQDSHGLIAARHPVIADYILGHVAGKEEVMEAYRRLLLALAKDIYPGAGRRHRSWRLFVRIIRHSAIYEQFGGDIDHARGVYESTAHAFANDGHFWLQYANLEVDHGQASSARPLIANAEGLLGPTDLVLNTRAHMMLREALTVGSHREAQVLRTDAEDILRAQMDLAGDEDEYPYHVYLTHMLGWIRAWAPKGESKKRELEALLSFAKEVCERMPRNRKLKGVHDAIMREYLTLATEAPNG